jgi:glycosyltransferase involved in cell wall biosynthesis
MSFNITINGRFLTRPPTGVDRFAIELLRAWLPVCAGNRSVRTVMPAVTSAIDGKGLNLNVEHVGNLKGHAWEQFDLPRHCRAGLLLNLCNTGPARLRRQLVVLHDASSMANPRNFSAAFRSWYRWLFASLMKRANVVATVSEFSASELMRHVGGRGQGIEIVYEGGEHVLQVEPDKRILARLGLADRPYVLAVGNRTPNKNFAGVVKAAGLLVDTDIKVVAAGGSNSRVFRGVELTGDNLVLAGYVTDGELRALYEGASCFLYPSFYEGFGLPPLEAMHCGCPVVVSDRASMPEVCGPAALYCDPDDPRDIASQLRRVLTSSELRAELKEAGHARARLFSWARAAAQFEDVLLRNQGLLA